jgi:amino acid transporter
MIDAQPPGMSSLRRQLGLTEATALGIGGVIGSGIFVLSGIASGKAGPAVMVSFVLAFVASLSLAFCYAELSSLFPKAGGPYTFANELFGPRVAALTGWTYWGAWVSGSGFVSLGFGNHLAFFTGVPPAIGGSGLIFVFVLLNLLGIRFSAKVQVAIMLTEVTALVTFILLGAPHVDPARYHPFAPHGLAGVVAAALIAFLALTGWDVIVVAAEEISNPRRNVPLAVLLSLGTVLILYLGVLGVANGVVSWQRLGNSATPIGDASRYFLGSHGPQILDAIILVALTATANSFLIVISRTAFAMARDGLAPRWLARTVGPSRAPWPALLSAGAAELLVVVLGSMEFAISATGVLYLLTFIVSIAALVVARRRRLTGGFKAPAYPLTAMVALSICLAMLATAGRTGILGGALWLVAGVIVFAISERFVGREIQSPTEKGVDGRQR